VAESTPAYSPIRRIARSADVYELCRGMTRQRVEVFRVLLLSSRHDVLKIVTVSRGSLSSTIVHPREVFRPAILASAAAIVLVHNHPSGDPDPSGDDLEITQRLARAGEILGIDVLDHVVIATGGRFASLRDRGILT
jgi:DNA repair protein RadC